MKPEQWILEGEVGISSQTIWAVMMGVVTEPRQCGRNYDTPHDPDDFSRCVKLIILLPEWRERLSEVSGIFPKWIPYIREWKKLEQMYWQWEVDRVKYQEDLKEYHTRKQHTKKLQFHWDEMYNFMQILNKEAMLLDGWKETSPNSYERTEEIEGAIK